MEKTEGNEDVFKNESMENPVDEDGELGAARFLMPAQRGATSTSVNAPVNKSNPIDETYDDRMDEGGEGADEATDEGNENEVNLMRDVITVECQKFNGNQFIGTVNYSEAKIKIFQDGLGLDAGLLGTVKISFNKCPVVTFKLK